MFNAQRYMYENDAYFAPSTAWFPYEMQYLDIKHPHYFTLDLDQLETIFKYRFYSEWELLLSVFFLWFHCNCPQYLLYLQEKLVDGLADDHVKPLPLHPTTATTSL